MRFIKKEIPKYNIFEILFLSVTISIPSIKKITPRTYRNKIGIAII